MVHIWRGQGKENRPLINWDELIWLGMRPRYYSLLISRSLVRSQPGSPSGRKRRNIHQLYRKRRTRTIPSSWGGAIRLEYIGAPGVALLRRQPWNNRSSVTRAGRAPADQYRCRCRFMVRELPAGRLKLRLFFVRAM